MKALASLGPAEIVLEVEERPKLGISAITDAIIKATKATIFCTDLHILELASRVVSWARVMARCDGVAIPLEAAQIPWQR